ncbi:TPA: hypothetical protein IAC10_12295 [Candidatus Scatousia excrementigallinarum]|uniref:Glycoside hydrolase family 57 N-terminal domain-containing protein n=1 Tax=Candidatus Scatousia excrementigallinarum TaxID=2840935 RepID=A0A9D1JNT1_9BACT|nr:hypothetical protein [Candidatus Scatousia excrementigallinarum]
MMSQNKKLSIAFYWHMHQPVYQLSPEGDYLMPWTRLHAVKDYLDMVTILDNFKDIKLNFNVVPVLLDAFIDYGEKGLHDLHSRLTVTDIKDLTEDDKEFILNNFFDSNYRTMILPYEEYNRLFQKRQTMAEADISAFSEQEYSDLMALFNLAWFDPSYKNEYIALKKLFKKGKGYTLEDRQNIIEIQRDIIRRIIPAYRKYVEDGKIEITTSPYYHPILPILLDISSIKIANKEGLPVDLKMPLDAKMQTVAALDRIEELTGKRPRGIWPSEHCVSPKELDMFKEAGAEWSISDEGILSESINFEFVRDFKGYLEEPYHLLKSYEYKNGLKMVFRNSLFSNLIGFEYPNYDSVLAANDLYDRIKVMQSKLLSSPDENHILTIAMDGENCWENYPNDGINFLKTLYELIEKDESLETVLISDYLDREKNHKPLKNIASGSWINRNFKLWIDEPLKNLAWNYLKQVRDDFSKYVKENPYNPNIELARRELFIAEGSDWFWWYGEPNDSGRDNIFDYIFREHLKNIYLYLGLEAPEYLDTPLLSAISKPSRYPKGEINPVLDGLDKAEDDSWLNAGCISIPDGPVLKENKFFDRICFGYDKDNLYLRFYVNDYIKNNPDFYKRTYQMYIYTRNSNRKHSLSPIRLINKTEKVLPVTKEKFHNEIQLSICEGKLRLIRLIKAIPNNLWVIQNSRELTAVFDKVIDLKIPFDILDVAYGESLEFVFVNANIGLNDVFIPNEMLLNIRRD